LFCQGEGHIQRYNIVKPLSSIIIMKPNQTTIDGKSF
jgi:hypothetical protein